MGKKILPVPFLKLFLPFLIALEVFALQLGPMLADMDFRQAEAISEIRYVESLEDVENPGRGFYSPACIHYAVSGNEINTYAPKLMHMRLDLSEFSGSYNQKKDLELSQDMLDALEGTLENLESQHCNAIVRFAYDPWFGGSKTYEPALETILRHQEQLGEVLSRHEEVVVSLECGIFGKWGEMHGSEACTQENFNPVIDKWLEVLPDSIPVSVRTPGQYCGWAGMDRSTLAENVTCPGQKEYRVGIYNDGYLGSNSDLGTYADREKEVAWLSLQAKHTLFGGEIGPVSGSGEVDATAAYMAVEGFQTHTSYLNRTWNFNTIEALKQEVYAGTDQRYLGQSGYAYVQNHLGYRFVVREVRLTKTVPVSRNLLLEIDVENVGFANLVKPKEFVLILSSGDQTYRYPLSDVQTENKEYAWNCDPTLWDSQTVTTVKTSLRIGEDVAPGEYQVYLRMAARDFGMEDGMNGYPIRFANDDENIWNENLGANLLGSIQVTERNKSRK